MLNKWMMALGATTLLLVGCQTTEQPVQAQQTTMIAPTSLKAYLSPTEGHETLSGYVTFKQHEEAVTVLVHIEGLPANSTHGLHIHQYGDCSAVDGMSAGGHFNPHDVPHGGPDDMIRHVGDLGNVTSNQHGMGHLEVRDAHIAMHGLNSIVGKSVIVHAQPDDFVSQPVGNAGARLLCGVIGVVAD